MTSDKQQRINVMDTHALVAKYEAILIRSCCLHNLSLVIDAADEIDARYRHILQNLTLFKESNS